MSPSAPPDGAPVLIVTEYAASCEPSKVLFVNCVVKSLLAVAVDSPFVSNVIVAPLAPAP
jgi:hypothetical protein